MNVKPFIRIGIPIVLSLILLFFAFAAVDIRRIIKDLASANMGAILLSSAFGVTAFILRAHRWALLIEPFGTRPRILHATASVMAGYVANLALPRLGEFTRCAAMAKDSPVSFNRLLGTVIIERVVDVVSLMVCIFLALAAEGDRISGFFLDQIFYPLQAKWLGGAFPAWAIGALVLIMASLGWIWTHRRSTGISGRFIEFFKGIGDGTSSILKLKSPVWFVVDSVLIWFLYFLGTYVCFFALPQTETLDWSAGLVVLVIGGLGMAAPVQGGFGTYHLMVSGGLILFGLTYEEGLSFATLVHSLGLVQVLLLGLPAMYFLSGVERPGARAEGTLEKGVPPE
jgi:uncharacterized membrane protein YbhN (UPF0104 family)